MAYITAQSLAGRLPLDGEGLSPEQIQESIDAAVEYVVGLTGHSEGTSPMLRKAVLDHAMADLEDTLIYPQDAHRAGTESSALWKSVERAIDAYLKIKTDEDQDPLTLGGNIAYVIESPF